jgi:hypothetical protein
MCFQPPGPEPSHVNRFLGSSHGAQHHVSTHVQKAIVAFGPQERPRLAAAMRPKTITVCADEPVHPEPCVVAIEPGSDVIPLERYRERRDAASWNEAMAEAVHGLAVEIVQATGDEAREAAAARERAERQTWAEPATRDACDDPTRPRGPGRRPGLEQRIEKAQPQQAGAPAGLERAIARQVEVREALQGLSSAYHPDDLATGEAGSADDVARDLQPHVDQLQRVVTAAGRSERARGHVENARHVRGALGSTIAFVHVQLLARMVGLALGIEWPRVVLEFLRSRCVSATCRGEGAHGRASQGDRSRLGSAACVGARSRRAAGDPR